MKMKCFIWFKTGTDMRGGGGEGRNSDSAGVVLQRGRFIQEKE